jgi:hypothetical protein
MFLGRNLSRKPSVPLKLTSAVNGVPWKCKPCYLIKAADPKILLQMNRPKRGSQGFSMSRTWHRAWQQNSWRDCSKRNGRSSGAVYKGSAARSNPHVEGGRGGISNPGRGTLITQLQALRLPGSHLGWGGGCWMPALFFYPNKSLWSDIWTGTGKPGGRRGCLWSWEGKGLSKCDNTSNSIKRTL